MLGNTLQISLTVINKAKIPWATFFVLFTAAGIVRYVGPVVYDHLGPVVIRMEPYSVESGTRLTFTDEKKMPQIKDMFVLGIEGIKTSNCVIYKEEGYAGWEHDNGRYDYSPVDFHFGIGKPLRKGKYSSRGVGKDDFGLWGWVVDNASQVDSVFVKVHHMCGAASRETVIGPFKVNK